jgi:hypothetical protein
MRRACLIALACCALGAVPAGAAPAPSYSVTIAFTMPATETGLWLSSAADCLIFTGGWSVNSTRRFVGHSSSPRGLLDVSGRSGEAIIPREGIHVDRIFGPRPKALAAADVGLQLAGRRTFLTGVIRSSRSSSARTARRVRLVRVAGTKIAWKTAHGQLVITVRGRAALAAPLANAFERLRCKGPRLSGRPIRPGLALGPLSATIVAGQARALAGLFATSFALVGSLESGPSIVATGTARVTSGRLQFAWTSAAGVPATCTPACVPSGGTLRLDGGFDLFEGATRLAFTDLTFDATGTRPTLSATVGGRRLAIADGTDYVWQSSAELDALLASTFGDPDLHAQLVPAFTATNLAPS